MRGHGKSGLIHFDSFNVRVSQKSFHVAFGDGGSQGVLRPQPHVYLGGRIFSSLTTFIILEGDDYSIAIQARRVLIVSVPIVLLIALSRRTIVSLKRVFLGGADALSKTQDQKRETKL